MSVKIFSRDSSSGAAGSILAWDYFWGRAIFRGDFAGAIQAAKTQARLELPAFRFVYLCAVEPGLAGVSGLGLVAAGSGWPKSEELAG